MSYNGADLIFPHLNIVIQDLWNHITLFGSFRVAFYGIIIGVGMLVALLLAVREASSHGENPEIIYDIFIIVIISGIIGARIYYVVFEWENYSGNLIKILNIREGGLAIYGGIIGALVGGISYCRIKKYSALKVMDCAFPGVLLAQGIGRWGNFFNCEAFGGYTDSLFAMRIKLSLINKSMLGDSHLAHIISDNGVSYIQAHPAFLYESCWDIFSFIILHRYSRKHKIGTGGATLGYFLLYGTGRFFIESIRTDQLLLPGTSVPVSQLLSLLVVLACLFIVIFRKSRKKDVQHTF